MNKEKLDKLKELAAKNPNNIDYKRALADFYINEENYNLAYEVYQDILKVNEYDIQALLNSGSIRFYAKDYEKSKEFFQKAIEFEPENSLLHYNLANVYAEVNDFNNAIKEYKAAFLNGMNNAQICNAIGVLYMDNSRYTEAKAFFLRALSFEPENSECLSNYATLCQRTGNLKESEKCLLKAFELKNTNEQIALALANLYAQMKKKEEAKKFFEIALKLNPQYYSAWVCRAIFHSDEKDFDNSIQYYKNAIELEPKKPNAYMLLAHLLLNEKRYTEAIDIYKKSVELTDNKAMVYIFIANAYMLNSDMKNAIDYYRLAIKEAPLNQEVKLIYIDIMNDYIEGKRGNAA